MTREELVRWARAEVEAFPDLRTCSTAAAVIALDAALSASESAREEAIRERDAAVRTLSEARAVALGGDGMTHEQALAAVVSLVADLRAARAREGELRRGVEALAKEWDEKRATAEGLTEEPVDPAVREMYADRANIWEDCADGLRAALASTGDATTKRNEE